MDTIDKLIEDYANAKAKFQKDAKKLLMQEFKTFFKEVPEIKVIKWTQYTPYFNDGDECIFGVNSPTFSNCEDLNLVSEWGELDMDEDEAEKKGIFAFQGDYEIPDSISISKQSRNKIVDISALIQNNEMSDVFKDVFGDHVCVIVTKSGIDTEEIEHD